VKEYKGCREGRCVCVYRFLDERGIIAQGPANKKEKKGATSNLCELAVCELMISGIDDIVSIWVWRIAELEAVRVEKRRIECRGVGPFGLVEGGESLLCAVRIITALLNKCSRNNRFEQRYAKHRTTQKTHSK